MKSTLLAWFLSFIVMPLVVLGDETVKVGNISLKVPMPEGFARLDGVNKESDELLLKFVPPSNRLLLVATSPANVASIKKGKFVDLKRYMMLQSFRAGEGQNVSLKDFAAVRGGVEKQFGAEGKGMKEIERDTNAQLKKAKLPVDIKMGETQMLGVFDKGERSIDMAMLTSSQVGEEKAEPLVVAASIVLVGGKVCYLYVYATYNTQEDIDWARNTVKLWRLSVFEANPAGAK